MTKELSLKYILLHYGYATSLCALLYLIFIIPTDFVYYYYPFIILGGLLSFYHLTNTHKFGLTILSFFLNFIAWTAELVSIEKVIHDTPFYQSNDFRFLVLLLGGFLLATNKIIIDLIFKHF